MKKLLCIILAVSILLSPVATMDTFARGIVCNHPTSRTEGHEVACWYTTHTIIIKYVNGKPVYQTCTIRNSIEEIFSYCPTCGYEFGKDTIAHELHSTCGASY